MSTILVTGATGFLGSHLVEHLAASGHDVVATAARAPASWANVRRLAMDVTDRAACEDVIAATKPSVVYHLAAQSLPGVSWREPERTFDVNVLGTLHLLDAIRAARAAARVVLFGSSSEYASSSTPIREDHRLRASDPYALSKLAATELASLWNRAHGMNVVVVRPFLVVGTRKVGDAANDFAHNIVRVERGESDHLAVGNLEAVRDFLPLADALRAFTLVAERGAAGEAYNVCSGRGTRVRELLDALVARARVPIDVRPSDAAMRPLDEPVRVGDPGKLRALGWSAEARLEDALGEVLDHWRAR